MRAWPNPPNQVMDGIAICAAMMRRDEGGELVVTACNSHFLQMMGGAGADVATLPIPFDALIKEPSQLAFREQLLACCASRGSQDPEQTYDFRDDTQWWRLSLKLIAPSGGATVREILVTGFDITAKMRPPQESEVSALRYRALVDLAYDAIVTIDHAHNITLFNRAAENLFGYCAPEVLGRRIEILLPEKFRAHHARNVQQFADSYQTTLRQATPPRMDDSNSVYGRHRDGSIIPVEIAVSKIEVNGTTEFTAVVRDITDRARLMELLKKQATTDVLTGLPNRREFLEYVEKVLGANEGISVFILDIDFFKHINDGYGHDAGDEVLRVLAKVGASMMHHEPHLFARWGGEEFVAALPGADANLALGVADQLRRRFERQDFEQPWRIEPIPFTVSIGVATREAGEGDVDALMKRADRALYRAKQSGRNRVEVG
jgi:diguanylate cyclase (GGDEF)-like protein/PAS domain S-box-containing protein